MSNISGFLFIDKPLGLSSNGVLSKVKRLYGVKGAGFVGTLDPLASGVLVIALGEATKLIPYIKDDQKTYQFQIKWGHETTTLDAEGEITQSGGRIPNAEEISKALKHFDGAYDQMPPQYSALKVDGRRAYDLARKGEVADLKTRRVEIHSFVMLSDSVETLKNQIVPSSSNQRFGDPQNLEIAGSLGVPHPRMTGFQVTVSKGTYIRSLARDLAHHLGTLGTVIFLRRIEANGVCEKDLISIEKLAMMDACGRQQAIKPLKTLLDDISALALSDDMAQRFLQGQRIRLDGQEDQKLVYVISSSKDLGLGEIRASVLHPLRVFNLSIKLKEKSDVDNSSA